MELKSLRKVNTLALSLYFWAIAGFVTLVYGNYAEWTDFKKAWAWFAFVAPLLLIAFFYIRDSIRRDDNPDIYCQWWSIMDGKPKRV
jgi:hypothetical protein